MRIEHFITANSQQFIKLVLSIQSELYRKGRDVITIEEGRPQSYVVIGQDGKRISYRGIPSPNSCIEIFIHAQSKALRDKGIAVIVSDWDGAKSKLVIEYRDNDDWEFAKDTWEIFEERIRRNGWQLSRKSTAAFAPAIVHDARHLFEDSRREQIEAMKLLHGLGNQDTAEMNKRESKSAGGDTPEMEMLTNGTAMTESFEIVISGTPYEIAIFAIDFGEKQRLANSDAPRYYLSNVPKKTYTLDRKASSRFVIQDMTDYAALQNSNRLIIECVQGGGQKDGKYEAENHLGTIIALKIPNNRTQLRVIPQTESAVEFLREWELLRQEMIRLGFAKLSGQDWVDAAPKNAGRPQDPINTWAIEQIRANRDRSEIEKEYWQKRRERGDNVDAIPDMRDVWKKNVLSKIEGKKRKN